MTHTPTNWIGIDYGSKLAGTTVLTYLDQNTQTLKWVQSPKKQDADAFILEAVKRLNTSQIFIDAPLSLPWVYQDPIQEGRKADYFYRACDRTLKAMSPMFLGGLTARAMRLKANLEKENREVIEVYPKALLHSLSEDFPFYKKQLSHLPPFWDAFKKLLPLESPPACPANWHQVDGVLAWWTGERYRTKKVLFAGLEKEGLIWY